MKFKADTMNALLKIITDIDCNLYVDGVLNTMVSSNEMTFISLERGEYWVQLISVNDPYYKIEQVISMESNKVIVADFCSLIKDEDIVFVQREGCYRNLKSNTNITSKRYDRGNKFIDGLAKVYRNGMWGQINKVGEEVTACKYLDEDFTIKCILPCNFRSLSFSDGMAKVYSQDGKVGFVDEFGNEVIPCVYHSARDFKDGKAWANNGSWGIIDKSGNVVFPFIFDHIEYDQKNNLWTVVKDGKFGAVDENGKEIIPSVDKEKFYQIKDRKFPWHKPLEHKAFAFNQIDGKWGVLDKYGNEVIPFIYDKIWHFFVESITLAIKDNQSYIINNRGQVLSTCNYVGFGESIGNGLIDVVKNTTSGPKLGLINCYGQEVTPCIYDDIQNFDENGLSRVSRNNKFGFIDTTGKELVPCIYDEIISFGDLFRVYRSEHVGIINKYGKEILPCKYDNIDNIWGDGYTMICLNGKWGYVDENGKVEIPCQYDRVDSFCAGYAPVCKNGKWGLIDKIGREIINCIYDEASIFVDGLARVAHNDKYGFVDKLGKIVIPFIYDYCTYFEDGFARVLKNDKWGLIDRTGAEILPCYCDEIGSFHNGLAEVKEGCKWGLINTMGTYVCPCIYDNVERYFIPAIKVWQDGKCGLIDQSGKSLVSCVYDRIYDFSEGFAKVCKNKKYGMINYSLGHIILPCIYDKLKEDKSGIIYILKDGNWGAIKRIR